jgi:uncharacterized repeat protein (TIGR01451 family)
MSHISQQSTALHRHAARLAITALASLIPAVGWAVCSCGFGDGQFTQVPIGLDGNMADWAPVHADIDNNVCDGPSGGLLDRDAPVQSTGRDLTHFAFTWDLNNIYLFTERFGSASNTQTFVYYGDIDNDGLMETNEPVIGVTWRGSNRTVNVYIFSYVAQSAGGDLMSDGSGFSDGYTLPGSFANVPPTGNPNYSGTWGSATGLQMEFSVTWADLGVTPGAPFTFHVSSSNASLGANNFAAQIDDNLSGCGGGPGSTVVPGVSFVPDRSLAGFASQTVAGAHTLTNTGNASDRFDLSSVSAGDFAPTSVSYYHDVDANGIVSAPDVLLNDSTGNGDPDTPLLAPSESIELLIAYDVPVGVNNGDLATVTTTVASDFEPLATDFVVDTITITLPPDILVTKLVSTEEDPINGTVNPKAIPGSRVLYTIMVSNQGAGTVDNNATVVSDAIAADLCFLVTDAGTTGSGPVAFQDGTPSSGLNYTFTSLGSTTDDIDFSDNDGVTFDYAPSDNGTGCDPDVTNIRINPQGTLAADTGGGAPGFNLIFQATVN